MKKIVRCSPNVKGYLFKTYCCNLYCAPFWYDFTKTAKQNFKVAYNNSLRWHMLGLPNYNSGSGIFVNLNIPSFGELLRKYVYNFRNRLETSDNNYLNYETDLKKTPINLDLDFSKAFDSLSHTFLIGKLKHYDICDVALKLMKSYLENRKQYVQFDACTSDMKSIRNGVPQGSIQGSLLFLIYINDFPNSSKLFNFLMYANDTTLFCCLKDIKSDNKELVLNNELQSVHSWLKDSRLSLNVKKTKYNYVIP